jgi:hypothetical protein
MALAPQGGRWLMLGLRQVNDATGKVEMDLEARSLSELRRMLAARERSKPRYMSVPFGSVQEYLFLLRAASQALEPAGTRGLLFLSAGRALHR